MAQFSTITQAEMEEFLGVSWQGMPINNSGWYRIPLDNTNELVYAKLVAPNVSLRVYSSIVKGLARGKGDDAIRVVAFWRPNKETEPRLIGTSKRVHRVMGWKKNLSNRLIQWKQGLGPTCKCGAPTVFRAKDQFFGCCLWPNCPRGN